MGYDSLKPVDVISECTADGEIVPLKLRVKDDNGEYQSYRIDSYKNMTGTGTYDTQDGVYVNDQSVYFRCNITVFGKKRTVTLYYWQSEGVWRLAA